MRITNKTIRTFGLILGEILFIWSIIHLMTQNKPSELALLTCLAGGVLNLFIFIAICVEEIKINITIRNPFKRNQTKRQIKDKIITLKKEFHNADDNRKEIIIQEIVKLGDKL